MKKEDLFKLQPNTPVAKISVLTEVKLKGGKKNPQQGRITKISTYYDAILCGTGTYAEKMKERLVLEGKVDEAKEYKPKARAWGKRIGDSPVIEHKDQFYLEFITEGPRASQLLQDGKQIEPEDVEGLPEPRKTDGVMVQSVKFENILGFELENPELDDEPNDDEELVFETETIPVSNAITMEGPARRITFNFDDVKKPFIEVENMNDVEAAQFFLETLETRYTNDKRRYRDLLLGLSAAFRSFEEDETPTALKTQRILSEIGSLVAIFREIEDIRGQTV